jgi:AraC-like DNA-binding protein
MSTKAPKGSAHHARAERFVSDDVNAAIQHFGACGLKLSIRPLGERPGRIELNTVSRAVDGVIFTRSAFDEPVEIKHDAADAYQLLMPLRGSTIVDLGERAITCESNGAAVFNVADIKAVRRSAQSENYAVFVSHRVLTNRLFQLTGAPVLRQLSFQPEPELSRATLAALGAVLAGLEATLLVPGVRDAPHSAKRFAELLADLMIELLPHNYQDALSRKVNLIAPEHVKRTINFIKNNTDRLLTAEELVPVSGVSLRTLQYGFQKFLGVSISDYERSVRLDRARRDIERNPGERVAVVARRWNFSNFTRFNTQFEAAFGISAVALRASRNQYPEVHEGGE